MKTRITDEQMKLIRTNATDTCPATNHVVQKMLDEYLGYFDGTELPGALEDIIMSALFHNKFPRVRMDRLTIRRLAKEILKMRGFSKA